MLLFCDSFAGYKLATDISKKWTSSTGTEVLSSVLGGGTLVPPGDGFYLKPTSNNVLGFSRTVPDSATLIAGVYIYHDYASVQGGLSLIQFLDASTEQCSLRTSTTPGKLTVNRGSTVLGTSAAVCFYVKQWIHLEFKATIHATAGKYEVRVNGATVLSGSGVDTNQTANAFANGVQFMGGNYYYSNAYILDTSGSVGNDFIGPSIVKSLYPALSGSFTEWSPASWTNLSCVNRRNIDETTFFTQSGTISQTDTFRMENVPVSSGSIIGIQYNFWAKTAGGGRTIAPVQLSSGSVIENDAIAVPASYADLLSVSSVNPATGNPYTIPEINAAEFGYRLKS